MLFVNGLPVATIELKTDNMQSIDDAVAQYRTHRDPKGGPPRVREPVPVHFAVSSEVVVMTTRLAGRATHFLPFNLGHVGGAGNPVNPGGRHPHVCGSACDSAIRGSTSSDGRHNLEREAPTG